MTKAEREKMLAEKLEIMQELERNLRAEGLKYIAGIDEVGTCRKRVRCFTGRF